MAKQKSVQYKNILQTLNVLNADNCYTFSSSLHNYHGHVHNDMHHAKRDLSKDAKSHFNCVTDVFSLHSACCHCSKLFTALELLSCGTQGVLEWEIEFHTCH